jgi:hypothetical protein
METGWHCGGRRFDPVMLHQSIQRPTARKPVTVPPRFLNVDVDVESREPLDDLVAAMPSMAVLRNLRIGRKYYLSFEGPWFKNAPTPDEVLRRLTKAIGALRGEPRRLWRTALRREFNLGFDGGEDQIAYEIPSNTVESVARLGGSIGLTLYPIYEPSPKKR